MPPGYNLVIPDVRPRECVDVGLKYVNNDACYPSLIVIGQIMSAVMSGKYDLSKTAILISQTGGGCRATNYIGFIRRALTKAGHPVIPVSHPTWSVWRKIRDLNSHQA